MFLFAFLFDVRAPFTARLMPQGTDIDLAIVGNKYFFDKSPVPTVPVTFIVVDMSLEIAETSICFHIDRQTYLLDT